MAQERKEGSENIAPEPLQKKPPARSGRSSPGEPRLSGLLRTIENEFAGSSLLPDDMELCDRPFLLPGLGDEQVPAAIVQSNVRIDTPCSTDALNETTKRLFFSPHGAVARSKAQASTRTPARTRDQALTLLVARPFEAFPL